MENIDKIKCVLIDFENSDKTLDEAAKEILLLFSVSCQCDACKQDRIDCNYRKYIELNKNVIGYD